MILTSIPKTWTSKLNDPLLNRIEPANDELIAHISAVSVAAGLPGPAQSVDADEYFRLDVIRAIEELPLALQSMLEQKLLGIYFGRCLGSSAISDIVVDEKGAILGTAVVLDLDILEQATAKVWATWKENTPFRQDGPYAVTLTIESDGNDTRQNALQYILLHEFGHALCVGETFVPPWWAPPTQFRSSDEYSFLRISWQIAMSGQIIALLKDDFALRTDIAYYTSSPIDNALIEGAHAALERTRFVTLYAASSVYEDFAESFASYVHQVMLKKPFRLRVLKKGYTVFESSDYWSGPRATAKRRFFEVLLGAE